MEIKCKLKQVNEVVERNNFKSRKVWVTTEDNPQYPQVIELEVNQSNIDKFSNIQPGTPIVCSINLRGREYNGKVFNTLVCWKVVGDATQAAPVANDMTRPAIEPLDDEKPLPF